MRFISWDASGLRAAVGKSLLEVFHELDTDFFCLQETKLQARQIDLDLPGYYQYWNYAERRGYSGTAIFTRKPVLNATYGMGIDVHDTEDRLITLEYSDFFLATCYMLNSQSELKRLDYRLEWEGTLYNYLENLKKRKPIIVCGDLNVTHQEVDLKNWKANQESTGFTPEEGAAPSRLLDNGFIDTFRYSYPTQEGVYSWQNYRFNSRKNNTDWRIDYFLTSKDLRPRLADAKIHTDIMGSDHYPAELGLKQRDYEKTVQFRVLREVL